MPAPLYVTPVPGEVLCFKVESRSRPGMPHTVRLLENGGKGVCTCESHRFSKQKAIDAGEQPFTKPTMCVHVEAACWDLLRAAVRDMHDQTYKPRRHAS